MKFKAKRFYESQDDFNQFHSQLKQTSCPRCQAVGYLNLHGYLRGYDDADCHNKIIRGRRIFCSNRGQRLGCSRTFSILASDVLKKFIVSAKKFWHFLKNIAAGSNKIQAFKTALPGFSSPTCYRLYKSFRLSQTKIRSKLLTLCDSPLNNFTRNPEIQTISHLYAAFNHTPCPITAFQNHFQAYFL